jgi:entericidin B
MHSTVLARIAAIACITMLAAGCANTIRGVGADAANTVQATQDAGDNVARAAR